MATPKEYIDYVVECVDPFGTVQSKLMFGEYMVYINEKPVLLVCDGTVYIKKLEALEQWMKNQPVGNPYKGAKEHYILDIENRNLCEKVIPIILEIIPISKRRR